MEDIAADVPENTRSQASPDKPEVAKSRKPSSATSTYTDNRAAGCSAANPSAGTVTTAPCNPASNNPASKSGARDRKRVSRNGKTAPGKAAIKTAAARSDKIPNASITSIESVTRTEHKKTAGSTPATNTTQNGILHPGVSQPQERYPAASTRSARDHSRTAGPLFLVEHRACFRDSLCEQLDSCLKEPVHGVEDIQEIDHIDLTPEQSNVTVVLGGNLLNMLTSDSQHGPILHQLLQQRDSWKFVFLVDSIDIDTALAAQELAGVYGNVSGLIPSNYSINQLACCINTIFAGVRFWPEELLTLYARRRLATRDDNSYDAPKTGGNQDPGSVQEHAAEAVRSHTDTKPQSIDSTPAASPKKPQHSAASEQLASRRANAVYAHNQRRHAPAVEGGEVDEATLDCLTPRQREVLSYLATGKSNKYIAAELEVCESTIKVHVSEIMRRLGATSRTHASYIFNSIG